MTLSKTVMLFLAATTLTPTFCPPKHAATPTPKQAGSTAGPGAPQKKRRTLTVVDLDEYEGAESEEEDAHVDVDGTEEAAAASEAVAQDVVRSAAGAPSNGVSLFYSETFKLAVGATATCKSVTFKIINAFTNQHQKQIKTVQVTGGWGKSSDALALLPLNIMKAGEDKGEKIEIPSPLFTFGIDETGKCSGVALKASGEWETKWVKFQPGLAAAAAWKKHLDAADAESKKLGLK